jgi:glycosyltransferase involved in cell wall biosynthesis
MTRILFVHNKLTRFVQTDRDLLAERYAVTERYEPAWHRLRTLRIWRAVRVHDLVFCWFASWHALTPVLAAHRLGKPVVVVVGGYDTANVPEAGYGSQRGGIRRLVARTIIRRATSLITHSDAARREAVASAGADPAKVAVVYLGVEPGPPVPPAGREPVVLTVGNVWRECLLRKGLLPFVRAAAHLPHVRFIHVGRWCDDSIKDLRRAAPPNVALLGFLPDAALWGWYARAAVYVQASLHEGFGLSVAEAMSAGCTPVVTRAGSLPEVVGDTGVYIPSQDPREIARGIQTALDRSAGAGLRARERVQELFTLDRRRAGLRQVIDGLLNARAA